MEDAQDFTPNMPPAISNATVTLTDGSENPVVNLISDMQFKITADVADPENGELEYAFASDQGSFAGQESTATGISVIFVTAELTCEEKISVTLTVKDPSGKNNTSVETIAIGTAKPAPKISISQTSVPIASTGTATITLTADCTGSFQLVQNDTAVSASEIHIDTLKNVFGIETETGTAATTTATISGPTGPTATNHSIRVSTTGPHTIWAVFKDLIGQETAVSCTVTVE
ncbi:MAG: hypothetical protein ACRCUT_04955 [Spirochaetota bacterium]